MELNLRRAHRVRHVFARVLLAFAVALPFAALQAESLTNTATVTVAAGVVDPVPGNNTDTAVVTISAAPAYDFCPAGTGAIFNVVNGVDIWRYDAGAAADVRVDALAAPVTGTLNGLMVDPVRNRLLFVQRVGSDRNAIWAYDVGNGGWYEAVPAFVSPNFPRAAIGPDGVGYLIASGSAPAVWRLTASPLPGSYGYSVQNIGTLAYDAPPTDPGSGDIAFDASGAAWLSAGIDLYTIDPSVSPLVARRQVRPLLGGNPSTINWAGMAFGHDGRLYVSNNGTNVGYYAYDPATGALTLAAAAGAGVSHDLASCAFPPRVSPELSVGKTLAEVNGAAYVSGAAVQPGDVLGYDITIANGGDAVATLYPGDVIETLPAHTIAVAAGNDFSCTGNSCPNLAAVNVAAGDEVALRFVVEVADPLPAAVTGIANAVSVAGVDCAAAGNDCTETTPLGPTVAVSKTSVVGDGTPVSAGQVLTYTLQVTVANAATDAPVTLTDTPGAGLAFGAVTDPGVFQCTGALSCVLPAGQVPGVYALRYTATVEAAAIASVDNTVATDVGTCSGCSTLNPVLAAITVEKTADPADGSTVLPGATLAYTLAVTIANSPTTEPLTLTDTPGAGLAFGAVTDAGVFQCSGVLTCVLPAGQAPGRYALTYTATVEADASGNVGNVVVAGNPPGGDPDPVCTSCSTRHRVEAVAVIVRKEADPAAGTEVLPGDVLTYTLTADVRHSVTTDVLTLVDTLGAGLAFAGVADAGAFACTGSLECTLPAGTAPGSYSLSYTALVEADASGDLGNVVVASGGNVDTPPDCSACTTTHRVVPPRLSIAKSSNPGSGAEVAVGDTIQYTLEVLVEDAATRAALSLVDTPDAGLAIGVLPAGCSLVGTTIHCVLPAGTVPGRYAFAYPATVTADAAASVANVVVGESGDGTVPECASCATTHELTEAPSLRVIKVAGARDARIGDLVRYTLTVENVGTRDVGNGIVLDTPPAGFTYVEDSMAVADGDGAHELAATRRPLRISGLYIAVGGRATITYLLRVGAGVRAGVHVNAAVAVDGDDEPVSNVATAQLVIEGDPMLDDSLVFGTVFDDRDGDGWQDSGRLDDIRIQGGFEASAYVPGSTTLDRGNGPEPVADASAPLLRGLALGGLAARESAGQPARRIVLRQLLREPAFTGDFVLDTAQGMRVRMDAQGVARSEARGDAARGLNAAAPAVERRVAQVEGGIVVEYVVSNEGIDERGIAGVRLATVDGLLVETDEHGRYHLAGIHGGDWARGHNLVLKVDPATLPPGTVFTTDNPLLRRVTPGLPARFDFGVGLPVQVVEGGSRVLELELGEVVFTPGSADVRERYLPVVERVVAKVEEHDGAEVVITATAGDEALAFARAVAVRDAIRSRVSEAAAARLWVVLLTDVGRTTVAGIDGSETLLGTVLFETDRAEVRPGFDALLDEVARRLEALGGGPVAIVGHTDVRGSHAYNAALGLRRAQAVYQALLQRLGPEARAGLRVESSADPATPAGGSW